MGGWEGEGRGRSSRSGINRQQTLFQVGLMSVVGELKRGCFPEWLILPRWVILDCEAGARRWK